MAVQSVEIESSRVTGALDRQETSLFDRFPWIYVIFREHLFRDDTALAIESLWPDGEPVQGTTVLDLGCGPGFYARKLAAHFPQIRALGIDRSQEMVGQAQARSASDGLRNCRFIWGDARAIPRPAESVDAVISSRLLMMLSTPEQALAEMHRVLRPGSWCLIAEPRSHPLSGVPLRTLWAAANASDRLKGSSSIELETRIREPRSPRLMPDSQFTQLIESQPWGTVRLWKSGRYQYANCRKQSK